MSDGILIRLPDEILVDVEAYARARGSSVEQFCAVVVARAVTAPDDVALILPEVLKLNVPTSKESTLSERG